VDVSIAGPGYESPVDARGCYTRCVTANTFCPGCGVVLPPSSWPVSERFHASRECWEKYGELAAYTQSLRDPRFPHQHAVDAYGASHVGPSSKPIMAFFALVGLYLACERGLSGRTVQLAHMELGRAKREWPVLVPPRQMGRVTVVDVIAAPPGEAREVALMEWARSVWAAWVAQQPRIRELTAAWLPAIAATAR